ncbi:hypothetical protein C8E99_2082 [Citricoccus muralis]|uniref:Uncharacterized protein n=1 Tax=Citricoccus muralis TaxID=169134 RepID=A0A3D9LF19_9MICC|nr:hypothetical protein C8E99_2082 [Citricoccus muralis]
MHFHTELIWSQGSEECWLWIDVSADGDKFASTPRLVRRLVESPNGLIAGYPFGLGFTRISDIDRIPDLVEFLGSEQRDLPVFVAEVESGGDSGNQFLLDARSWARDTAGLATFIALDADSARALREALPARFTPPEGAVRTYLPGVDFENPQDARRHRILGADRMARDSATKVGLLLGTVARRVSQQRPIPGRVRAAQRLIQQAEDRQFLEGLFPSTKTDANQRISGIDHAADHAEAVLLTNEETANVAALKEMLGVSTVTDDFVLELAQSFAERIKPESVMALQDKILKQTASISDFQEEKDLLEAEIQEMNNEFEGLVEESVAMQRRIASLQRKLAMAGKAQEAYEQDEPVDEFAPEDFAELVDHLRDLEKEGVVFTGDKEDVLAVDSFGRNSASMAWKALKALGGYLRAKGDGAFQGNVHQYLNTIPPGYPVYPATRHAPRESETTMKMYGDLRRFAVPSTVDPDGSVTMQAHFKLHKAGMKSPRIHYCDASSMDGRIYVGYIGEHLRVSSTN